MSTKRTISIGLNNDGRLEVFYVAKDGSLRHNWQRTANGLWASEETLAQKAVHVATGVNADGRLEAFWITPDGELLHDWQTQAGGKWVGAAALHVDGEAKKGAKTKAQSVAVASKPGGRPEVVYNRDHSPHDTARQPPPHCGTPFTQGPAGPPPPAPPMGFPSPDPNNAPPPSAPAAPPSNSPPPCLSRSAPNCSAASPPRPISPAISSPASTPPKPKST